MSGNRITTSGAGRAALAVCACLALSGSADVGAASFAVQVQGGTRVTAAGDTVRYDLFVPRRADALPPPPWPAVVLTHGFARNRAYHRANAEYLASHGIVVMTPNMVGLLGGRPDQLRNIDNTVDHLRWLQQGAGSAGLVDPQRTGLAGHSAGGAVSFEAAIEAQQAGVPIAALVLLDAVPWPGTLARAAQLAPLALASLRSEPSPCNAGGALLELLDDLAVPVEDVLVSGATHCDPENPSDALCAIACGAATPATTGLYQQLMTLFFQDALRAPPTGTVRETYFDALARLAASGAVARSGYGPVALLRLRIDGQDRGEGPHLVNGRARVGLDLYLRGPLGETDWQLAVGAGGGLVWLTPTGLSRAPATLFSAPASPLYAQDFISVAPPAGTVRTLVVQLARDGTVLARGQLTVQGAR